MTDLFAGDARPTSLNDRRRRPRRGGHDEHQVTVIDGLGAGARHDCVYRDVTPDTASLLVRAELRAGQRVRIQQLNDGSPVGAAQQGEVIRSRALTTGRWELLVEFPRVAEAPKVSESQRRHERRQARVTRSIEVPVSKTI